MLQNKLLAFMNFICHRSSYAFQVVEHHIRGSTDASHEVNLVPHFSLLTTTMQNPRRNSEKKRTLPLDIVRVGGRYRVGKLLGAGASGEFNSDSSLTLSELVRERLPRKGHYDGG